MHKSRLNVVSVIYMTILILAKKNMMVLIKEISEFHLIDSFKITAFCNIEKCKGKTYNTSSL